MNKNANVKILVVDDEPAIRKVLSEALKDEGFQVLTAVDGLNGLKEISVFRPDIVLLDIWMPGDLDGLDVLKKSRVEFPDVQFIVMSGHGTIETAVKATKLGAWDFVEKPISLDKINILIKNILNYQSEKKEKESLLNRLRKNFALIGGSGSMKSLKQLVSRVSPTESWALIMGSQGSGKELVAQNIHYLSERSSYPFVKISCRSVPVDLLQYEFFGYEKGVFAGAEQAKKGKIELANKGTLFLEEVTSLPIQLQQQIINIFKSGKVSRVGGKKEFDINIRLLASTSEDIEEKVKSGEFLEELYNRISTIRVSLPDLKDKKEDIPLLVNHFAERFVQQGGEFYKTISTKVMNTLMQYEWPGNINELKNFIERVYILTPGDSIELHDLKYAGLPIMSDLTSGIPSDKTFREARAQFEKEFLIKKIHENDGNISKTAETIGLERSYLHRKIKLYGIEL